MKKGNIKLTKEMIDAIFDDEKMTHQADVTAALYEIAIPGFNSDCIESIDGFPTVHEETQRYTFKRFREFDRKNHPGVFAGGLWFNSGFSTLDGTLADPWEISIKSCTVTYAAVELMKLSN